VVNFIGIILQLWLPSDSVLILTIQQVEAINGGQEVTGAVASDEGLSHHMVRAA